jgi:hypothetical protein
MGIALFILFDFALLYTLAQEGCSNYVTELSNIAVGIAQAGRPPSLLFHGFQGFFSPRVKQLGCEANGSPPSSVEFKNGRLFLHSPICLHEMVLN